MVATTMELMSNGPSIGWVLKRTLAQETADECAHDPKNDVTDHAESLVALHQEAREVAGDRAKDDPGDDAHEVPPSRRGTCTRLPVDCLPEVGECAPLSGRMSATATTHGESAVSTGLQGPVPPRRRVAGLRATAHRPGQ